MHFVGFTYKRNVETQMKETIQTLFREIDSAREKKVTNRRNSEKKNKVEANEVINQSDHALLKRQRTYDLQQASVEEARVEVEKEKIFKKLPYSSSSFVTKKDPTKLLRYDEEGSRKLQIGSKKGVLSSTKLSKVADSTKKLMEKDATSSYKPKLGANGVHGLGLSGLGLKRNNSPKVKTQGNPLTINSKLSKASGSVLTPKEKTPGVTPTGLAQNISTGVSSSSSSNVKRIINQLKTSTANKTKFNLNFKDLSTKTRGVDTRTDFTSKMSFKNAPN